MRSTLAALFMLATFTLAAFVAVKADANENAHPALPRVVAVLPDPLPMNLASVPEAAPATVKAPRAAFYVNPAPAGKVWTCGAPRGLASDASATVRVCEYR